MSAPAYRRYALERVTKVYNGRRVLDVEALEIAEGQIFGLVGPSGSGKSTLLRLLNFLEAPTTGVIRFGDYTTEGHGMAPMHIRRSVTTVFQRPVLLNTTVFGNVAYGLRLRRSDHVAERVHAVLEQVGLSHMAATPARRLSGGEMQRVALARAIVVTPQALLLDEPTANLDPYNVGLIERIVTDLNRERGTTVVLVTHNVFQAKRLAHQAGLLLDGRLIEVGPSRQFFAEPSDPRTGAFVRGEMIY
jgi:tungstate transport system ATP-binding protein